MKKTLIYAIIIGSSVLFIVLAVLSLVRIPGLTPLSQLPENPLVVEVVYKQQSLDLSKGETLATQAWQDLPDYTIKLEPQVTAIPWATASTPEVHAKAFHNGHNLYFLLRWRDDVPDAEHRRQKFSDACAIMFALVETPDPQSIMMGFMQPVNIWHWKAVRDAEYWHGKSRSVKAYSDYYYPYETEEVDPVVMERPQSAVEDIIARGVASVTPKEKQRVVGRGYWIDGYWSVVISRPLYAIADDDAHFAEGKNIWAAFGVWNGGRGERGSKKSISTWTILNIQPKVEFTLR